MEISSADQLFVTTIWKALPQDIQQKTDMVIHFPAFEKTLGVDITTRLHTFQKWYRWCREQENENEYSERLYYLNLDDQREEIAELEENHLPFEVDSPEHVQGGDTLGDPKKFIPNDCDVQRSVEIEISSIQTRMEHGPHPDSDLYFPSTNGFFLKLEYGVCHGGYYNGDGGDGLVYAKDLVCIFDENTFEIVSLLYTQWAIDYIESKPDYLKGYLRYVFYPNNKSTEVYVKTDNYKWYQAGKKVLPPSPFTTTTQAIEWAVHTWESWIKY